LWRCSPTRQTSDDFRYWHKADVLKASPDVRFRQVNADIAKSMSVPDYEYTPSLQSFSRRGAQWMEFVFASGGPQQRAVLLGTIRNRD
jgi:hypothetical protein